MGAGIDVRVVGVEKLERLAARLKDADKGLRRNLLKRIRTSVQPLRDDEKESARDTLPEEGGLAALIASSKFSIRTKLTGSVSVRLTASSEHDIKRINAGRLRHRVFGQNVWVSQQVPKGWFDNPTEKRGPAIRRSVVDALDDLAAEIKRGL